MGQRPQLERRQSRGLGPVGASGAAADRERHVSPWPFVGMAGMACAFFLYAASGLVAPWWAVVLLLLVWVALLGAGRRVVDAAPDLGAAGRGVRRGALVPGSTRGRWLGWTA